MENVVYQDLYKFNFLSDPVVSPDGTHAIFTKQNAVEESNTYTGEIWIIDLATKEYHPLTTGGKERGGFWIDKDNVAFVANRDNDKGKDEKKGTDEFDSYFNMLDVSSANNVTIEGVGVDAEIFQWGFTWKKCNSIEVRNLTFTDYPEDACSFQGGSNSDVNTYGNYWIHNNVFNRGKNYWDVTFDLLETVYDEMNKAGIKIPFNQLEISYRDALKQQEKENK